ncbi:hypothetical protein A2U01_0065389, partial [Trifolium medium]|nr:hypothetical protein [Trifolium medium]
PHPDHAPAAEEDDGEQLGKADFQEDDDAVQKGVAGKKEERLEGPSWTECIFPPADQAEFPGGPKDTSVLTSYEGYFARYVYEGFVS